MSEQLIGAFTGLTLGLLIVTFWSVLKMTAAVARMERRIDALVKHAGIDLHAAALREIEPLVKAGQKIEAIKVYRELTGVGLAEAKDAVEKL